MEIKVPLSLSRQVDLQIKICRIAKNHQGKLGRGTKSGNLCNCFDCLFNIFVICKESGCNTDRPIAFQGALVLVDHGCTVKSGPHTQLMIRVQHCTYLFCR